MTATAPKEGKIELIADCDGVFQVAEDRFDAVNELEDVTIATLAQNMPVKKGMKLAGMRVTPLFIAREKMDRHGGLPRPHRGHVHAGHRGKAQEIRPDDRGAPSVG